MTATAVPRGTPAPVAVLDEILLELVDVDDNVRVDVGDLTELMASIAELGVIQPIKVTAQPNGRYRVVWGQRRVLACRELGRQRIPAIVEPPSTVDVHGARRSIEQLSENLQRKDLNPIEEAVAIREVLDADPKLTQEALADKLGMSRPWVSNTLGLLEAAPKVQALVRDGSLTASHVKSLRGLAPKTQVEMANEAVKHLYSAHRLEDEVQRRKRQAEAEAQRARETAAQVKKNLEAVQAAIDELTAKKKPGLDAEIVVFQDYYGQGDVKIQALAESLTKAGFTGVRLAKGREDVAPRPKGCTCTTWKATLKSSYSYRSGGYDTKLQVTPACIVSKHRQDKAAADAQAERDKYALQGRVQARVRSSAAGWGIPAARAIAIDRILAEAALFSLLNYQLPEWSVKHRGTRTKPWGTIHALSDDDLGKELAAAIAGDFRDHAGYHVDWPQLAEELGVTAVDEAKAG